MSATGRGMLTPRVADAALELLGRNITVCELRLMPYIQYAMMNNQRIETRKIKPEERDILSNWRASGWIEGGASGLAITKDFWDAINELMWLAYVATEEE